MGTPQIRPWNLFDLYLLESVLSLAHSSTSNESLVVEADDYVDNHLPSAALDAPKVMILARVSLGRQFSATTNMYLDSPPYGYDSVRTSTFIL